MKFERIRDIQEELVAMRRELHQIPELGKNLPETRAYVLKKLDEYGIEYSLNGGGDCGVIAYINRGKGGRTVAFRADMDALPIPEKTGAPYASTNGCMHACGHDAHMAMLLGAAKVLNESRDMLNGEVRLLFQTGEESNEGAREMLRNNALDGVDAVFGTHIGTIGGIEIPAGKISIRPGPEMASVDRFTVRVKGKGCHGSTPEKGIDPVNIAAHIIIALQTINSREFGGNVPCVITVGKISGGSSYNVIPDEVVFEGTTRSFDDGVRRRIAERIEAISGLTARAFGGDVEFTMGWGAAPVVNDAGMAAFAAECAEEVLGRGMVITSEQQPVMIGEDFSLYLEKVPGAFMLLSSSNPEKGTDCAHHSAQFEIDEDVLWEGTAVFAEIAGRFLA